MSYQVSLNYDTRLPYIKPSTLSTLSAQQKNIDSSLPSCGSGAGIIIFVAVTQEAPSKQLLPRKETASLRRQTTGGGGDSRREKDRPGWRKTSRRKERAGKRELSRLEGRTFPGTKQKRCEKWRKKWAAREKREARGPAGGRGGRLPGPAGGAGAAAGVGISPPTARVRAAGALPASPGRRREAGGGMRSGKASSSSGRGSRVEAGAAGTAAHPPAEPRYLTICRAAAGTGPGSRPPPPRG